MRETWAGNGYNLPEEGHDALSAVRSNPDDVIEWWKVPQDIQDVIEKNHYFLTFNWFILPCLWPFIIFLPFFAPCFYSSLLSVRSENRSLIVIITKHKLIYSVEIDSCTSSTGKDVTSHALKDIISVKTDRKGASCLSCGVRRVAGVRIELPGFKTIGGENPTLQQNFIRLPSRDEEAAGITAAINIAKENSDHGTTYMVGSSSGMAEELEKLTMLWQKGALSDHEFQQGKQRIMSP